MANGYVGHFVFWETAQPIDLVKASVKGQFGGMNVRLNSIEILGNPAEKNGESVDPIRDQFQKQRQFTAMRSAFLGVSSKKTVL